VNIDDVDNVEVRGLINKAEGQKGRRVVMVSQSMKLCFGCGQIHLYLNVNLRQSKDESLTEGEDNETMKSQGIGLK
jgi:hypothetical protein